MSVNIGGVLTKVNIGGWVGESSLEEVGLCQDLCNRHWFLQRLPGGQCIIPTNSRWMQISVSCLGNHQCQDLWDQLTMCSMSTAHVTRQIQRSCRIDHFSKGILRNVIAHINVSFFRNTNSKCDWKLCFQVFVCRTISPLAGFLLGRRYCCIEANANDPRRANCPQWWTAPAQKKHNMTSIICETQKI